MCAVSWHARGVLTRLGCFDGRFDARNLRVGLTNITGLLFARLHGLCGIVTARVLRGSGLKEVVVEPMAVVGFPCWIRGVGCVR